jgi:hypothetical protein
VVVRSRLLDAADRTVHRGLPVTARGLTVLETAAELGGAAAEMLLDRVLQDRLGWVEVLAAHRRTPAPGAARLLAAAIARSAAAADVALVRLLRGSGLRGWHRLPTRAERPGTVVFPAARVAVEASGLPGCAPSALGRAETATHPHGDRDSRGRPAEPPQPGWRLLRFSRAELTARPAAVLDEIAAAVDGRDLHHLEARIGPSTGEWR